MSERLQKIMAKAGIASRRASEKLILAGKVFVNGKKIDTLGFKADEKDLITVEGKPLVIESKAYYLFYKPRGVISAVKDDKNRKVVSDYFKEVKERLYPVGRLDYDTSGLLLMTNDGKLAQKLMHPKYKINKTYIAKVKGLISNDALKQLRKGVRIDGRLTAPAKSKILKIDKKKQNSIVQLIIHEGRYHQVKKMFEKVGFPVQKLRREAYAFLTLEGLTAGKYRKLTKYEIDKLLN